MNVERLWGCFVQPGKGLYTMLIGCSLGRGGQLIRPTVLTISKYAHCTVLVLNC